MLLSPRRRRLSRVRRWALVPALALGLVLVASPANAAETFIESGPEDGALLLPGPVTYTFSAHEGGATYDCRVDNGQWTSCSSGTATYDLPPGGHLFEVRSDVLGMIDATPAQRIWTIRNVPCEQAGDAYAAAQGRFFEWQGKLVKAKKKLHQIKKHGTARQLQRQKDRIKKIRTRIFELRKAMNEATAQEAAVC